MKHPFKFIALIGLVLMSILSMSCSFQVPSGNVGIMYNKFGGDKGVESVAYKPGVVAYNPFTQDYKLYPTFERITNFRDRGDDAVFDGISFSARDGNEVKQEVSLSAYTDETHAPILFQRYREDFDDILSVQVKQRVRDYFNQFAAQYGIEDIYGEKRGDLLAQVEKAVKEEFEPKGVLITHISYLSKPRFSPQVEASIEGKIVTQQDTLKAQEAVAKAKAEADSVVERARGQAEANKIVAASLSPQILQSMDLENQRLLIEAMMAGKVAMPTTYVTSADRTFLPIK